MLINSEEMRKKQPKTKEIVTVIFRYILPFKWQWIGLMLLSFVMVAAGLVDPLILKFLIDDVLTKGQFTLFLPVIFLFASVQAFSVGIIYVYSVSYERFMQRIFQGLRNDLFMRIEYQQIQFFRKREVGDLMRTLTTDISSVRSIVSIVESSILSLARLIFILSVIVILSWKVSILLLLSLPFYALIEVVYIKKLRKKIEEMTDADVKLLNFFEQRLSNILLVKLFSQEQHELRLEKRLSSSWIQRNIELIATIFRSSVLLGVVTTTALLASLLIGGYAVIAGTLGIGGLIAIYAYTAQLFSPVESLVSIPSSMQQALVSGRRIFEILSKDGDVEDGKISAPIKKIRGDITFSNVSFAYPEDPSKKILKNVSFHIRAGEEVAVTGESGSGKTTLILLLLRFYEPMSGEILIDGHHIDEFSKSFLRTHIGIVPQMSLLFPSTVADNISYAKPTGNSREIQAAAKLAGIHDHITSLPKKYKTVVGTEGSTLSEGEKQRLSLARVFLRKPDLYIFDEPTSSLDAKNEEKIKASISSVTQRKTALIVAHRLSTIRNADRILVLDKGKLVEDGNHKTLLKNRKNYFSLYCKQFPKASECKKAIDVKLKR